jgi:hypothetical protein
MERKFVMKENKLINKIIKKFFGLLFKTIFCLPIIPIISHIYYIITSLIYGTTTSFGFSKKLYGVDAMMYSWTVLGFIGILYIPFIIYQIIYLILAKQKLFNKLFLIQIILILILEFPFLYKIITL